MNTKINYGKVAPVLKWAGGKRQLLSILKPLLPEKIDAYCEPFVGGGAMLFSLRPEIAYVNDICEELMLVYRVIRNDVSSLIHVLRSYENDADTYYSVRGWDRDRIQYAELLDVVKAARTIYLNKTCYNGLFRVNAAGEFNTPFGRYKNPNIVNAEVLLAVSEYLNSAAVYLSAIDYVDVLNSIPSGTFVYIDPPYYPISETSKFTGYSQGGFTRDDQIKLCLECGELDRRGVKFMLTNSSSDFIREQYAAYNITTVQAIRAVNSNAAKRGAIEEVVVRNYG